MDRSRDDLTTPPTSVPTVPEINQVQGSDNTPPTPSETPVLSSQLPDDSVPSIGVEQPEMPSESHPRAPTPPPTEPVGQVEEVEHAYWAEFEEDTSTPDAEEMKEINSSDQDYSACDRRFHPKSKDRRSISDENLLRIHQIHTGRATSSATWTTPNMCPRKRLG